MNRKELYSEVNSLNLQDEIKKRFGKNYTQVSSSELERVVASKKKAAVTVKDNRPRIENPNQEKRYAHTKMPLEKLVDTLEKKHILLPSEVKYIME